MGVHDSVRGVTFSFFDVVLAECSKLLVNRFAKMLKDARKQIC